MKFLHAGAIYVVANIASAAIPFLLLPLLTRVFTPAEYASVVGFAMLVTLCTPLAGLSVHSAVGVAWFNRSPQQLPALVAAAIALALATTLLVAPLAAVLIGALPGLAVGLTPGWAAIAALTAGANVLLQCRLVLWQSQGRPVSNALLQFTGSALNVGLSVLAVLVLNWGAPGRNAGIAVAAAVMATAAVAHLSLSDAARGAVRRDDLSFLIRYGVPLIPHVMAGVALATADRWIISAQLGSHELGIYGAGAQLGMVMATLADAFVKAYNPWLYGKLASADPDDRRCAVGAIYAAVPAFLCIGALLGALLYWGGGALLGPSYRAALGVLPWFMLGGAFSGIYLSASGVFFFFSRTALLASVTTTVAVIGAVATWTWVSALGLNGAAIGYATTQGLLALFSIVAACTFFDLPWGKPGRALAVWSRRTFGIAGQQVA